MVLKGDKCNFTPFMHLYANYLQTVCLCLIFSSLMMLYCKILVYMQRFLIIEYSWVC